MTRSDDVQTLPENVRSTTIWLDDGEVMWPFEFAQMAVNALVGNGHTILGVDARERCDAGRVTEVAISDYRTAVDASDVDNSHREAVIAIARAEVVTGWKRPNILLTWR